MTYNVNCHLIVPDIELRNSMMQWLVIKMPPQGSLECDTTYNADNTLKFDFNCDDAVLRDEVYAYIEGCILNDPSIKGQANKHSCYHDNGVYDCIDFVTIGGWD